MQTITTDGHDPVHIETDPWEGIGRAVEGFYAPNVRAGIERPRPNRHGGYLRQSESPLERVLPVLRAADVFVPANITEGLDRALALKRERVDDDASGRRDDLEAALAAGEMTPAEFERKTSKPTKPAVPATERRASLQRAADEAYLEAHAALVAIGDELIAGPLAATCDELLAEPEAPGAEDRWRAMWSAVEALRVNGFASRVVMAPRTVELYTYPHRARAWALAEAIRRDRRAVESVHAERRGRYAVNYRRVRPDRRHLTPNATALPVAAAHRDEWGAKLQTADEMDRNLRAIQLAEEAL